MRGVVFRLSIEQQQTILSLCREIAQEAPLFRKTMPTGAKFRYLCTSAGDYAWLSDRRGYRYETKHPVTGQPLPPMPDEIMQIAVKAAQCAGEELRPESVLINWYDEDGKLGLHQDKTEVSSAPVVSISIGDDAIFIEGGDERTSPKQNVTLKSGDVYVMSGEHRFMYHGIRRIIPHTAPEVLQLQNAGRINLTVRQVYP